MSRHTLKVLLHYLAKHETPKLAKFCCMQCNDSLFNVHEINKYDRQNKICIIWS